VITTQYDAMERASSVAGTLTSLEKNYVTQASYVPHGGIRALPMGNNVWQVYSYNSRLQVQRIEDAVNNDPSQVLFDQHFEWGTSDNNGNLQSVVTNHGGPGYPQFLTFKEYYGYDQLNRVLGSYGKDINENLLWGENFSYDRYGNAWTPSAGGLPISGLTPTTNVYNTANRMNATTYDAAGNQTVVGAYALVYGKRQSNPSIQVLELMVKLEDERRAGGAERTSAEPGRSRASGYGIRGERTEPAGVLLEAWTGASDAGSVPEASGADAGSIWQ
jgi:hypothetical protein